MNIKSLSRVQRERLILVVLFSLIAVVLIFSVGLAPLRKKWRSARQELNEMNEKLTQASALLKQERELRVDLGEKQDRIRYAFDECIPDPENPLSWATQRVYQDARDVGIDIQSVSASSSRASPFGRGEETARSFNLFAVRIITECTYLNLLEFLQQIEERNPYVCISGLIISTQPKSPERHTISIDLQWPIWTDPAAAEAAYALLGEDNV